MAPLEQWQVSGSEPEFYELYKVPRLFGPLAALFLERIPFRAGMRVLDVACGTGVVARLAAARVAPSGRVVGVDLNEGMLAVARADALDTEAPIEWKQADASDLPFENATFDVALCQQGLQFLPDPSSAIREMRRVVTPGGFVALNVWGQPSRYNVALAEALAKYVDDKIATRSLAPFALGDRGALQAIVNEAGLAGAEIRTSIMTRRVKPTQEWLLQDSAGLPYAAAIATLDAITCAELIREIAGKLSDLWDVEYFAVPTDVHLVYAKR